MVKGWKRKEIELTDYLNDAKMWPALRRSRGLRGEAVEDIEWGPLSIELKTRKGWPPGYMEDFMRQAHTNCGDRTATVVMHGDYMKMGDQHVVMRLEDFVGLLKEVRGNVRE